MPHKRKRAPVRAEPAGSPGDGPPSADSALLGAILQDLAIAPPDTDDSEEGRRLLQACAAQATTFPKLSLRGASPRLESPPPQADLWKRGASGSESSTSERSGSTPRPAPQGLSPASRATPDAEEALLREARAAAEALGALGLPEYQVKHLCVEAVRSG